MLGNASVQLEMDDTKLDEPSSETQTEDSVRSPDSSAPQGMGAHWWDSLGTGTLFEAHVK